MPADAIGYVEINRPGDHVHAIARMLGLAADGEQGPLVQTKPRQIIDGVAIPEKIRLSPALFRELSKFRGVAAAITGLNQHGEPSGLAAVHVGDSDLIQGLLETSVQFVPQSGEAGGHPAFNVEGQVWIVPVGRLYLISDSLDQIQAAVGRLNSKADSGSLAASPAFRRAAAERPKSGLFGYVGGESVLRAAGPLLQSPEGAIARSVIDLDHLDALTFAVGAADETMSAAAAGHSQGRTSQPGVQPVADGSAVSVDVRSDPRPAQQS